MTGVGKAVATYLASMVLFVLAGLIVGGLLWVMTKAPGLMLDVTHSITDAGGAG